MSSIYIHIPFCKQACHYCDFHFSTNRTHQDTMVAALCDELRFRQSELNTTIIQNIYLGGGTPSLLTIDQITTIIQTVYDNYSVAQDPEITLEANPDDLTTKQLKLLSQSPVNRLSIGVQSFYDQDLILMNRAHNKHQAIDCITNAQHYFKNLSIDLIYGIPGMSKQRWQQNLDIALGLNIPHLSSYALTIEDRTALKSMINKGEIAPIDDQLAQDHYYMLIDTLDSHGYINYEFSNFGKPGYYSQNNTAYWTGKHYIGIGPSAHSYNGTQRSWNISNNIKYLKSIQAGVLPIESEQLSHIDQYNEYIMTALRTIHGISIPYVNQQFGNLFKTYMLDQAATSVTDNLLYIDHDKLIVTRQGKFRTDGIASQLFMVNL